MSVPFFRPGLFTLLIILLAGTCGRAQTDAPRRIGGRAQEETPDSKTDDPPTTEALLLRQPGEPLPRFQERLRALIPSLSDDDQFLAYIRILHELPRRDTVAQLAYRDTLLQFRGRVPEAVLLAQVNYYDARRLRFNGRPEAAKKYLAVAIEQFKLADSVHFAPSIARAHQLGSILGLMTESYDYGHANAVAAVRLFRTLPDQRSDLAGTLSNLGSILDRSQLPEAALENYREATAIYRDLGRPDRYFNPLLNCGALYARREQNDSAIHYYELALAAVDEQARPNPGHRAYVQNNLAEIYLDEDRPAEAEASARAAFETFTALNARREATAAGGTLCSILARRGRSAAAIPYGQRALALAGPYPELRRKVHENLAFAFAATGPTDSTRFHQQAARELDAELRAKKLEAAVAEAEEKYQSELREAEIADLRAEEIRTARRLRNQRLALFGGLVLLAVLSGLLYRIFRQRRRIGQQNETIRAALADKELLMKEIHHRVKNNLQMVSSLLSLQSRYLEDDGARAALRMGNSRVRSMALIHQRLYLEDEVSTRVDARDYVEKLTSELIGTADSSTTIGLHTEVVDEEIDIDTMIPLGLIANELVTNALKYAFPDRPTGQLSVRLFRRNDHLVLEVEDDGVGMEQPSDQPGSFGYLLIVSLVEQLEGVLAVEEPTKGTLVRVVVPGQ